jgi:bifunctional non-homologous end joining protein LigD
MDVFPGTRAHFHLRTINPKMGSSTFLDEEGHSRFEWLFRRNGNRSKGRLIYYVFDLLYLDGEDLRGLPLHRRKARITVKLIPRSATP